MVPLENKVLSVGKATSFYLKMFAQFKRNILVCYEKIFKHFKDATLSKDENLISQEKATNRETKSQEHCLV